MTAQGAYPSRPFPSTTAVSTGFATQPVADRELWACANEVLRRHVDRAPVFVPERIGALALAGDLAGVEAWKAIASKMDRILRSPESTH